MLLPLALALAQELAPPWPEVLGPSEATWPAPAEEVLWRGDLDAARAEAAESGRPLLVTLRCLPCEQCSAFDRDVLEGGPELTPLLARFVTVRLVTMREVDPRVLPYEGFQDLDLSWWAWILSGEGVLAVFGGRDEVSDATRISVPALANVLRRALDHHHDPRRASWPLANALSPVPRDAPARPIDRHPGWPGWAARGAKEVERAECLHCHQVAEVLRQPAIEAGTFDKRTGFWTWPFPENAGLALDRDDGLLVTCVLPGSASEAAGIEPGDRVRAAREDADDAAEPWRLLLGQADLRGVLHRSSAGDDAARVGLVWTRGAAVHEGVLALPAGWRRTDLGWRKSVAEAAVGASLGFPWPLAVGPRERERLGLAPGALAVRPYFPRGPSGPAGVAGLRAEHVIVAVDGESPDLAGRPFVVWFRLRHEPGDEVRLTVLEDGARRELVYAAPGP